MESNKDKSINSFFKDLSFYNILSEMEISSWKKDLLEEFWDLRKRESGNDFSGDTITQKIRKAAKENRSELEQIIKSTSNSSEEG